MLNANEPEATVVDTIAKDYAFVEHGDILLTIETTKAAADIEAETSGFFRLIVEPGQILSVGDVFGYITETIDDPIPEPTTRTTLITEPAPGLRITEPAKMLAIENQISLESLPLDQLITESFIQKLIAKPLIENAPTSKKMLIYGAGGHAKALIEMVKEAGEYELVAIVDDSSSLVGKKILEIPVVGGGEKLDNLLIDGVSNAVNGVGGIVDQKVRSYIFNRLIRVGFYLPAIIHPSAVVEKSAKIGFGTQVFANAYIGSEAVMDDMCMINTGAIISHDCFVGKFSHIAPGAMLAGAVRVENSALVGMGVTTAIGVQIGEGARIGNGAIILKDVPARKIISAGEVWR